MSHAHVAPLVPRTELDADSPVGGWAVAVPGASRVFERHDLDFCCHGHVPLREACAARGVDPVAVIAEIAAEDLGDEPFERFDDRPLGEVIDHILTRYHDRHRAELPRLLALAQKVERVHRDKPDCPRGLAKHLAFIQDELDLHMAKEEQVLFPLIRAGRGAIAHAPIQVLEMEHVEHAANLDRMRELTRQFTPPAEACGTWRALYLGLEELDREVRRHVHLENNVLFPRALAE